MSKQELDKFDIVQRFIRHELTRACAAQLLKLTPRQVTRLKHKVKTGGALALIHVSRGKPSHNRIPEAERSKILLLLQTKYSDFGPTFAAEKLAEVHHLVRDPKTIRAIQIEACLWKPTQTKSKDQHRAWRQRRSAYGEMIQFDGSYHDWLEGRGGHGMLCLLAAIDDASGQIIRAQFAEHEGVFPVLGFWKEYIQTYGKPRSIYLDKFSTYKMNSAVATDNPDLKTQFGRVLSSLEIEPIFANSPQAKGRVERLFDTLQDRLVKELRLANITSPAEVNRFLEQYLPQFNARFSVEPASVTNLHRPLTAKEKVSLISTFSRQEQRTVQNDFTFSFKTIWYQLTKQQTVTVQKKDTVVIEEWLDHTIHIRLRGKELNALILPKRPKNTTQPWVIAQTPRNPVVPPAHHPWRQQFHAAALVHTKLGDISTSLEK